MAMLVDAHGHEKSRNQDYECQRVGKTIAKTK